jgi:hypothetical protein
LPDNVAPQIRALFASEDSLAVQSLPVGLQPSIASSATWRSKTIAILLMVLIAGIFWVDSRDPALMKRYDTGTNISAKGSLTFGLVFTVDRSMPLATRVGRTTVNWLDANRVGMTFSFLFGPAALTYLAMLRRRRTTSVYLNTLFGAAVGAPLAVCTNCIAPIARGFFASGMSTESVLAAILGRVAEALHRALFDLCLRTIHFAKSRLRYADRTHRIPNRIAGF